MPNYGLAVLAASVILFGVSAGNAAEIEPGYKGKPDHGLDLANRWCASCHLVAPDQQRAVADVPPFAQIAQSPGFDTDKLVHFLLDPHPKMPELPLSRMAADDIATYIATLKK
jgi:mono/diheme cytochrome c family protein